MPHIIGKKSPVTPIGELQRLFLIHCQQYSEMGEQLKFLGGVIHAVVQENAVLKATQKPAGDTNAPRG